MPGGEGVVGVTYMVCPRQSTGWGTSSVDVVNTKNHVRFSGQWELSGGCSLLH